MKQKGQYVCSSSPKPDRTVLHLSFHCQCSSSFTYILPTFNDEQITVLWFLHQSRPRLYSFIVSLAEKMEWKSECQIFFKKRAQFTRQRGSCANALFRVLHHYLVDMHVTLCSELFA